MHDFPERSRIPPNDSRRGLTSGLGGHILHSMSTSSMDSWKRLDGLTSLGAKLSYSCMPFSRTMKWNSRRTWATRFNVRTKNLPEFLCQGSNPGFRLAESMSPALVVADMSTAVPTSASVSSLAVRFTGILAH